MIAIVTCSRLVGISYAAKSLCNLHLLLSVRYKPIVRLKAMFFLILLIGVPNL